MPKPSGETSDAGCGETSVAGCGETSVAGCGETSVAGCGETSDAGCGETSVAGCGETSVAGCGETSVAGCAETSVAGCDETSVAECGETSVAGCSKVGPKEADVGDAARAEEEDSWNTYLYPDWADSPDLDWGEEEEFSERSEEWGSDGFSTNNDVSWGPEYLHDEDFSEDEVGATCLNYYVRDDDTSEQNGNQLYQLDNLDSKDDKNGSNQMLATTKNLRKLWMHNAIQEMNNAYTRHLRFGTVMEVPKKMFWEILWSNACYIELFKKLSAGILYEGGRTVSVIPNFKMPGVKKILPAIETLYLWNILVSQTNDEVAANCILQLIKEAIQCLKFYDLPTGISTDTKIASLEYIKRCCLKKCSNKRDMAVETFRRIHSVEETNAIYDQIENKFLILFTLMEKAVNVNEEGVKNTAKLAISYIRDMLKLSKTSRQFRNIFLKWLKANLSFPG